MNDDALAAVAITARDLAVRTVTLERDALSILADRLGSSDLGGQFAKAVAMICANKGRIIVSGMGKSGLIARKIAATFASTGTPSFFLHPGEASHGDLGMITAEDVVLALSWSGETTELLDVLTYCGRFSVPLIAMTSRPASTLGQRAQLCLALPDVPEACPNNLAPTSSTTIQAALGDALAVTVLEARRFSPDDFRIFHPRGQLGARLVTVGDLMAVGRDLPAVLQTATIGDAIMEMSAKRFGITAVIDSDGMLIGAFSDGDLRRSLSAGTLDDEVQHHATRNPTRVARSTLASEALALMNAGNIMQLFVCEDDDRLLGLVHLHDILRVGVM